jgi:hypothetical protein
MLGDGSDFGQGVTWQTILLSARDLVMENAILEFGTFLGGMIVCIVHRRVSNWMWLAIASLAAGLSLSIIRISLFLDLVLYTTRGPFIFHTTFYALCWALFFTGLSKSFSDKSRQFDDMRVRERIAEFDQLQEEQRPFQQNKNEDGSTRTEIQESPQVSATTVED